MGDLGEMQSGIASCKDFVCFWLLFIERHHVLIAKHFPFYTLVWHCVLEQSKVKTTEAFFLTLYNIAVLFTYFISKLYKKIIYNP